MFIPDLSALSVIIRQFFKVWWFVLGNFILFAAPMLILNCISWSYVVISLSQFSTIPSWTSSFGVYYCLKPALIPIHVFIWLKSHFLCFWNWPVVFLMNICWIFCFVVVVAPLVSYCIILHIFCGSLWFSYILVSLNTLSACFVVYIMKLKFLLLSLLFLKFSFCV